MKFITYIFSIKGRGLKNKYVATKIRQKLNKLLLKNIQYRIEYC